MPELRKNDARLRSDDHGAERHLKVMQPEEAGVAIGIGDQALGGNQLAELFKRFPVFLVKDGLFWKTVQQRIEVFLAKSPVRGNQPVRYLWAVKSESWCRSGVW